MRLWTLHPRYLDVKGLVAAWREALLAQKVLAGETKGYKHHSQLIRFQEQKEPLAAIGAFLVGLADEATNRGYHFNFTKILKQNIGLNLNQIHLKRKLAKRRKNKQINIKMNKLTYNEKVLLVLIRKSQNHEGWAGVSSMMFPLVEKLPKELIELKTNEAGGWVKLTEAGNTIVNYL